MIVRAWGILAVTLGTASIHASPPDAQLRIGIDGKISPANKQDFFEPDSQSPPRLLPQAIREPLPPKFAPPMAGLMESLSAGPVDFGFPVRIAFAMMNIPATQRADFSESREPPLAEIP